MYNTYSFNNIWST